MNKIYIKKSERELELLKIINEEVEAGDMCFPTEDTEVIVRVIQDLGVNFSIEDVQSGSDYFTQCTYYSSAIGKTIIWDYDYSAYYETAEELAEALAYTENEIQELEKKLSIKK